MKARVPLYRTSPVRSVLVDTEATKGAIVGTNLYNQDGTLFDPSQAAPQPNAPAADLTTDDVAEGGSLYFTTERAQDAVGTILSGAGDVPLAYDDAGNAISASLSATGVAAGTYGDATHVARVTFDAKGRATDVQAVAISASSGGLDSLITDSGDAFMTEDGADLLVA